MAGELSFFELGVEDVERGRAFYEKVFGWRFEPAGQGFAITTPNVAGGIHGGDREASPYVFFEVDDLEEALGCVRELGGVVDEIDAGGEDEETVARFGRFKLCCDDQGSAFGLRQPPNAS